MRNVSFLFFLVFGLSPFLSVAYASGPNFNDTTSKPASSASPSFSGTVTLPGGVWETDGNVGIGTVIPVYKLDIRASSGNTMTRNESLDANNWNIFKSTDGTGEYGIYNDALYFQAQSTLANGLRFFDNSSGSVPTIVSKGGNVGIGTTSPTAKLQVNGLVNMGGGLNSEMGYPYEAAVVQTDGDTKFGVYTNAPDSGSGAASVALGYTRYTDSSGYHPGFEFQMIGGDGAGNNYVRYNYIGRDSNGNVVAAEADLFKISGLGDVSVKRDLSVTGTVSAGGYNSSDGSSGITDSSSYWLCTAANCATSCQVVIKNGLITGCN